MSQNKTRRQARRANQIRQKRITATLWVGLGILAAIGLGAILWGALQPAMGQAVAVMPDTRHVQEGEDPGPYNSDPPASGKHYASQYEAGFYEENSPEAQVPFPEGYLVHNLEHGYIIFWYNCDQLADGTCDKLKNEIQSVLNAEDNFKVIGFPRSSIDLPVVLTSWGQIMEFETFNADQARDFVRRNRNKAPEPNAP